MAIIIPSKNIYELENPKIRDNAIERIEIGATEVLPDNKYETPVHTNKMYVQSIDLISNSDIDEKLDDKSQSSSGSGYGAYIKAVAYVAYNQKRTVNFAVDVPILENNKRIATLLLGKNSDGEYNIKYTIFGKQISGKATAVWDLDSTSSAVKQGEITYLAPDKENDGAFNIPKNISITEDYFAPVQTAYANVDLVDVGTIGNIEQAEIIKIDQKEYFRVSGTIMCGLRTVAMRGTINYSSASGETMPTTINLNGDYILYTPLSIEITIYGNSYSISLEDKTVFVSATQSPTKKVFAIDGNELMQTKNYNADTGEITITQEFGKTLNAYKNGKETATLLCSISEYFDENGTRAISVNDMGLPMTFKMYDEVLPMVFGADGKDRPMSLHKDGSPKKFRVLGVSPHYNGAVWQEIYLQEV